MHPIHIHFRLECAPTSAEQVIVYFVIQTAQRAVVVVFGQQRAKDCNQSVVREGCGAEETLGKLEWTRWNKHQHSHSHLAVGFRRNTLAALPPPTLVFLVPPPFFRPRPSRPNDRENMRASVRAGLWEAR